MSFLEFPLEFPYVHWVALWPSSPRQAPSSSVEAAWPHNPKLQDQKPSLWKTTHALSVQGCSGTANNSKLLLGLRGIQQRACYFWLLHTWNFQVPVSNSRPKHVHAVVGRRSPATHSLSQIHHWLDRSWLKQCSVCSQLGLAASNPLSWGSGDRLANTVYTNGLQSGFGHLQTTALIHRHLKHHKVLLFRWKPVRIRHISCDSIALKA